MSKNASETGIHPTAILSPRAKIADGVQIGPHVFIDDEVTIGRGVRIYANAYLTGGCAIGENTEIHMGAVIGHTPQDLSFNQKTRSTVRIGRNNLIREYVTIHRGSKENSATVIGDNNFFMAHSHVGHDCRVGNQTVLANGTLLAGHVTVEDMAFLSGNVVVHQFVRIGRLAMIGVSSIILKDVPPFMLVSSAKRGESLVYAINVVGLRRAGYSPAQKNRIREAFKILYRSGLNISQGLEVLSRQSPSAEVVQLIDFIKGSQRGVCKGAAKEKEIRNS